MPDSNRPSTEEEKMRQVQSQFGAVAADYVTSKVHASGQDLVWLVEAAALTGSEYVLDVATGGGHTAFALAPHAAQVVALDLTRPMLEVAQHEATIRHLHNISFLEGNAQELPCADSSFDVVTCRHAPHHFPNVRQAACEWARVLKPGGKLVLVDSTSPEEPEADALLHQIESLRDPSHVRNYRISEWTAVLNEAGFTMREAREWSLFLDIPSWTQRMRTPPEAVATIERLMRTASQATRERLGIGEQDGALGFTLPVAFIMGMKTI
ncbi:MAG: class I SAM-dependent methyltransferase [Ktedonobacteraceae bacterium]